MSDITPNDLGARLNKLENKLDLLHADVVKLQLELVSAVQVHATKIVQHQKDIEHLHADVMKLEDRTWRASGAVVLGLLSFIGTAALAILTFVL